MGASTSFWFHGMMIVGWIGCLVVPLWFVGRVQGFLDPEARREITAELSGPKRRLIGAFIATFLGFCVWTWFDREAILAGERSGVLWAVSFGNFHLLWWLFSMPLLLKQQRIARKLGASSPLTARQPVRQASLERRSIADDLSPGLRRLPYLLTGVALLAFLARLVSAPHTLTSIAAAFGFELAALVFIVSYGFWARWEVQSPRVVVGEGEDGKRYKNELDALRRFRVRSIYALQVGAALVFFAAAQLVLEMGLGFLDGGTVGLVVGCLGGLIGILGAVFGVVAGVRGSRLEALKARLEPGAKCF